MPDADTRSTAHAACSSVSWFITGVCRPLSLASSVLDHQCYKVDGLSVANSENQDAGPIDRLVRSPANQDSGRERVGLSATTGVGMLHRRLASSLDFPVHGIESLFRRLFRLIRFDRFRWRGNRFESLNRIPLQFLVDTLLDAGEDFSFAGNHESEGNAFPCLLYTSPSPRD